ncbi:leucine-rich repeat extensin-like protein 6 [Magnolia sinica]|uniref:leucine-rich repeat extensin-like protein 6 n=1 Tax=Magnolia sinica TaxID=86752 RepID=UPI0026596D03|nr:leucine-rich repeat extensin-like protein 6 [Magnolia sinica]
MVDSSWLLLPLLLLLLQTLSSQAALVAGGGGGSGIWIGAGAGTTPQNAPTPASPNFSREITALQAWKSAITDDPFGYMATWVGPDVCSYRGIFCAQPPGMFPESLVVAAIDLNRASLQGTLVKELSLLTDLSILHLNSNRFSGTVPNTFKDLINLSELDLSNNQLSGPFPSVTLLIPRLIYLDLRYNHFSGPISPELFTKGLDAIFLNNNLFDGQIPDNLGNSLASVITLANNKFTGELPPSLGYMGPSLKEILLLNNQLTGCIPEGVGFLTEMQVLDVSYNSLTGHLPDSISCLDEIEVLNLAHNQLSGFVPDIVCTLKSLVNLTVSFNFFSGFSQECSRLFFHAGFDFSGNCIPGKNMQRPPPECIGVPGSLNCMRTPSARPPMCGPMDQKGGFVDGSYVLGPMISSP